MQRPFKMHQSLIHIKIHPFNRELVNYLGDPLSLRALRYQWAWIKCEGPIYRREGRPGESG